MSPFVLFSQIISRLSQSSPHLEQGSLLSLPSIEYKGRAFAFLHNGVIALKIDNADYIDNLGVKHQKSRELLARLQNGNWVEIPYYFHGDWEELTSKALQDAKEQYG